MNNDTNGVKGCTNVPKQSTPDAAGANGLDEVIARGQVTISVAGPWRDTRGVSVPDGQTFSPKDADDRR